MEFFLGTVLLILGVLVVTLGVLKYVLVREREKATTNIIEFLISNYESSKGKD